MFCTERPWNVLSNCHKTLMIHPSCCCFPENSGNNEPVIKSSQQNDVMFKYVNLVSGSPSDLKEAYKKQLKITFVFHVAKVLQCAQSGHQCPWDGPGWCRGAELVHNLHFSEAETLAADGSGVSVYSQPDRASDGCSWAAVQGWREPRGWSHLFIHRVSCTQQHSLALHGEAPKAACMAPAVLGIPVTSDMDVCLEKLSKGH